MKSRLTLIFAALVVLLWGMLWIRHDHRAATAAPGTTGAPTVAMRIVTDAQQTTAPAIVPVVPIPAVQAKSAPLVHVEASGEMQYIAREGDTVSQLAIALLGSDSKACRDAVIAANPALQSNPDRVLEGYTYSIAGSSLPGQSDDDQEADTESAAPIAAASNAKPSENNAAVSTGPKLKYTAQSGDTVGGLAANLLGGDTHENREAIVAGNASLQRDPDRLVAGKTYTIDASKGLAADPRATQAKAATSQPDADDLAILSMGRTVRYTALPGDTVSKLAVALLGSDTPANRDLIVKTNASLKLNPDHLVAGRTYWITVPTAAVP
jgi:phage tail protein X